MFDLELNNCYDIIINILFIMTILLFFMYILRYYFNLHFIIKLNNNEHFKENKKDKENKENKKDKKEEYIKTNDNKEIEKRYYLKDNTFLNDYTTNKKDAIKTSKLMINQLINKDLERYYRYIYPQPINDEKYLKKGYNDDDYEYPYNKYSLNPLEYKNDDLSAGLAKEADKIVLESKNNN